MKYYNDPAFLEKIGQKLGDVSPSSAGGAGTPPAAPATAPPAIEVDDLLAAARVGDEESVEDFLAIGKVGGVIGSGLGYNWKGIEFCHLSG